MNKFYSSLLFLGFNISGLIVGAQPVLIPDTVRAGQKLDSVLARQSRKVKASVDRVSNKHRLVKPTKAAVDLQFGEATRYQPLPVTGTAVPPGLVSKIFLEGTVPVAGIPLGFHFSNDQNSVSGMQDLRTSLFKFDFNPGQLNSLSGNELQQYYELRKSAFGGLDLTAYTQRALKNKLYGQQQNSRLPLKETALSRYLDQPVNVNTLLELDEEQMRQKLRSDLNEQKAKDLSGGLVGGKAAQEQLMLKKRAVEDLGANPKLARYFNDPKNTNALKYMNEGQVKAQLRLLAPADTLFRDADFGGLPEAGNVPNDFEIITFVNNVIKERNRARQDEIDVMSRQVFLSRISGEPLVFNHLLARSRAGLAQQVPVQVSAASFNSSTSASNDPQIDSAARAISNVKARLKASGVEVHQLLKMQKLMNDGNDEVFRAEAVKALSVNRPQNGLQTFFTRVQAFKLGAFGENAPGSTQNKDLFLEGTHLTYKAGNMPITIGYSGLNDIASAKDAAYQASNYNTSKSLSYLSLKVNKGVFGSSSISIIGSGVNYINNYNNYAVPSAASNNVALTLSKLFNMGDLGKVTVDVSKSTTLFYKDLTPDNASILDKKAGLEYSGSNLSQALSFGFNHQLDIPVEGLSEKVYFNYSGSGYQNPGNSGFGGGGMKFGGNFKKAVLHNKLILGLRTDINHRSISYTSNDQWKTYQVQLDGRYNISKKMNVSLKYTSGGTDKLVDQINTPVYTSQKYQIDGNASYKIGRSYTVSHVTIGKQDYNNTFITSAGSSLLMVNYSQSLLLQANSLTLSAFYNKELNDYKLIGDMLNSDLTYQYRLFRAVNLSTGITYLDNAGIANQAGIRQGVQLLAGKNFDIDSYVDLRRNLISPLYPELYAACRAELSLKYHIKY